MLLLICHWVPLRACPHLLHSSVKNLYTLTSSTWAISSTDWVVPTLSAFPCKPDAPVCSSPWPCTGLFYYGAHSWTKHSRCVFTSAKQREWSPPLTCSCVWSENLLMMVHPAPSMKMLKCRNTGPNLSLWSTSLMTGFWFADPSALKPSVQLTLSPLNSPVLHQFLNEDAARDSAKKQSGPTALTALLSPTRPAISL